MYLAKDGFSRGKGEPYRGGVIPSSGGYPVIRDPEVEGLDSKTEVRYLGLFSKQGCLEICGPHARKPKEILTAGESALDGRMRKKYCNKRHPHNNL